MAFLTACLPDSNLRSSIDWLSIHRFCGLSALGISTCAIFSGIMDEFGMAKQHTIDMIFIVLLSS